MARRPAGAPRRTVLFFGLMWTAAVQLLVGTGLAGVAWLIWRTLSGMRTVVPPQGRS